MSELKERMLGQTMNQYGCDTKIYLKSEVDEAIAKLKAVRKVHIEAIESMGAGLLQDEEEIRHHKYKRCLAMAKVCYLRFVRYENYLQKLCASNATIAAYKFRRDLYDKWEKRWLELAEKFKEAK